MIKGIQAFDACWTKLRSLYPTGRANNLMIAQAMGQVTDHYGTVEEIEQTLPTNLKGFFRRLAYAYFHGYEANSPTTANSRLAFSPDSIQTNQSTQDSETQGETEAVYASDKSPLSDPLSQNFQNKGHGIYLTNPNEAATFIIDGSFAEGDKTCQ